MSIKTAYQEGRIAYFEELSERGFGNPYKGESLLESLCEAEYVGRPR